MLYELMSRGRARRLFSKQGIHVALESVLAGTSLSPVYVDDVTDPHAAVTWEADRVYVAGEVSKEFVKDINVVLNAQYFEAYLRGNRFVVCPDREEWIPAFREIFWGYESEPGTMKLYTADTAEAAKEEAPPAGYSYVPVDKAYFMKPYGNILRMVTDLRVYRESPELFLKNSFGVAAVYGDTIVGWCINKVDSGDHFEVGVETLDSHMRRGLATGMTRTLLREGLKRGFRYADWHCWATNVAAVAAARRAGFTFAAEYPACEIRCTSS